MHLPIPFLQITLFLHNNKNSISIPSSQIHCGKMTNRFRNPKEDIVDIASRFRNVFLVSIFYHCASWGMHFIEPIFANLHCFYVANSISNPCQHIHCRKMAHHFKNQKEFFVENASSLRYVVLVSIFYHCTTLCVHFTQPNFANLHCFYIRNPFWHIHCRKMTPYLRNLKQGFVENVYIVTSPTLRPGKKMLLTPNKRADSPMNMNKDK